MIFRIILYVAHAYSLIIFIYCILSWFPFESVLKVKNVLGKIVDPYLNLFRKLIPPIGGTIDISPILAIVVLEFAVNIIIRVLSNLIIV